MENNEKQQNDTLSKLEKRLTLFIITFLVGFIATVLVNVQTELGIVSARMSAILDMMDKHDQQLMKHADDLRKQDNRLTRMEAHIQLPKI